MRDANTPLIFIVEDDNAFAKLTQNELNRLGYTHIRIFSNGEDCIEHIREKPDIVLLDYALSHTGIDGLEVLKEIVKYSPQTSVIMLTAYDKLEIAIDSIKAGAYDYVLKTDTAFERIANLIRKIIRQNELLKANKQLEKGKKIVFIILAIVAIVTSIFFYFFSHIF